MAVDLHLHSTSSDGTMAPAEIVARAAELNLSTIAITDHDSFGGIDEAAAAAAEHGINFIPGVELSAYYHDQDVHVLGYYLDYHSAPLNDSLRTLRESRDSRARAIVEKLQSIGLSISWAEVAKHAQGEAVGRPHIAQALVDSGQVQTISEVFEKYLARDRPGYVAKYVLDLEEIITLLHRAGGVTSLAHPVHWDADEPVLARLKEHGLDALEVWHSDHSQDDVRRFTELADKLGLLLTGGSDCHGTHKRRGLVIGSLNIPDSIIEPLSQRAREIQNSAARQ